MKIKFNNIDEFLLKGARNLADILGYTEDDNGILVSAVLGEKIGASLKDGAGTVYYSDKPQFFRELGVLIENAKSKSEFEIFENNHFKTVGTMIDTSRCAVPRIESVKKMIDYLAVMGYNMVMLYTEDTVELDNRPYFGYMRGRYTKEQLREIDDYAFQYGIEALPCIECYGHMEKYLLWEEAKEIKDTASVLLAREEKTFEFLDELISNVSGCFRSKRIHIGMDEAWDMGRGKFLDNNGYVKPIDIFNEYMERLIGIVNKYGLKPMMWSDMYFRASSASGKSYYSEDIVVSEETKKMLPENIELVFWHYGEGPGCDDYMLKKHVELDRNIIFAGGLWSWIGHFPEHNYAFETTKESLEACRKHGVKEMMTTLWRNDNAECDLFADLFGLSFTAEMCYNENPSAEDFKNRFEYCTGGSYEAFYNMSQYHNEFNEDSNFESFHHRFLGKPLFWQDIMEGLYDTHLYKKPLSLHYRKQAENMGKFSGEWGYLYDFATLVFKYMSVKCEIAEKLVPAYKKDDKSTLKTISGTLLPQLMDLVREVHIAHKDMWFKNNKIIGWSNLDIRYAGVYARCETAKMLIDAYLSGECDRIEELEEERLHKPVGGFAKYHQMATVNLRI